jgi:hypothetical protein
VIITGCTGHSSAGSPLTAKSQPGTGAGSSGSGSHASGDSQGSGALAAQGGGVGIHMPGNASGVTGGTLFGGNTTLTLDPLQLKRKVAIARVYYYWGRPFAWPMHESWMAQGTTLLVSLDSAGGGKPSYASIAAGSSDSYIRSFLTAMNQAASKYHLGAIYFCFEHEPNISENLRLGSPAEFARAWDHMHQLAAASHLNWNDGGHIHWVYILTHEAYVLPMSARPHWAVRMGSADAYWPGDKDVDIVAADGFMSYGCKQGQSAGGTPNDPASVESLFGPLLDFARSHGGMPVFITEWGATYFPTSQRQVKFITEMQTFLNANRQVKAIMYWDATGVGPHCNYVINGNPPSIAAMRTLAHSTLLQGHTV